MKLPDSAEMRGLDQRTIEEYGIPGIVLMENAGLSTVRMMEEQLGSPTDSFALIFIGPGNNGGDGLVIGRHLHQRGCSPIFIFLVDPDSLKGDAAANMAIIRKLRLPYHEIDNEARVKALPVLYRQFASGSRSCYAIVDGLFGTGLTRPVEGRFAEAIKFINSAEAVSGIPVISVDIPSGLDADSGKILGTCVEADHTATYGCAKPGQVLHHGPEFTGRLHIIDIGIPPEVVERAKIRTELLDHTFTSQLVAKLRRAENVHKGNHGHLAVLGGSPGKTGAAVLAVRGALRIGAGLVSLFAQKDLNAIYESLLVEAMTIPLPSGRSHAGVEDLSFIEENIQDKKALVIGPGLGTETATTELVLSLYERSKLPLILDADGLTLIAAHSGSLPAPAGPRIFTPHPGEMARMLGKSVAEIQGDRLRAAREACDIYGGKGKECVMVLKGSGTIVASSSGLSYINTSGNPGMATGGMGDTLAGVIGGLLCQGLDCEQAAAAAVFIHGLAGDILYEKQGVGYSATELGDTLPRAVSSLLATS